ncbi:MAG: hypothetical protein JWN58_1010 [Gammaproteobacteria bacterium]|nr:hypothetical protein [Gammaproteobacteria bacterium]
MIRKLALVAAMAVVIAGCTEEQKNTARGVAAQGIDAACNNLSSMDAQFAELAPRANRGAKASYASAKATLVSICNNRPIDNPEKQIAAVTAAVVQITGIIAQYVTE